MPAFAGVTNVNAVWSVSQAICKPESKREGSVYGSTFQSHRKKRCEVAFHMASFFIKIKVPNCCQMSARNCCVVEGCHRGCDDGAVNARPPCREAVLARPLYGSFLMHLRELVTGGGMAAIDKSVQIIRVFVSSPSDVKGEGDILDEVVARINRTDGKPLGIRIELEKWEMDVVPRIGPGPQEVVDSRLRKNVTSTWGL
jgi:hypothetical protein